MTSFGAVRDDQPLVVIAHTMDGRTVTYLHEVLPAKLREELSVHKSPVSFPKIDVLLHLLDSHRIQYKAGHYKTYVFPQRYLEADTRRVRCFQGSDPKIQSFGFDKLADKVYAIEQDGTILSACVSVRQNAKCAESWVLTAPEHRGRGLAPLTVTAWAKNVMQDGIIPFYSHKIDNTASANLANKLRLIPVFEEIGIERQV
jgi:RimJ/RimL family protein N-acetyltransferase